MIERTFEQEIDHYLTLKANYKVDNFKIIVRNVTIQGKELILDEYGLESLIMDIIHSEFDEQEQIEFDGHELL